MKGSYLSITEMAKLRNISSETLRYYDRIGLLKPDFVDPDTKYRYYSVLQSEKLGTIRELRSLGMSVEEVKDYFDGCHLQKSIKILSSHYSKLEADIERKLFLCQVIMRKLSFLGGLTALKEIEQPRIQEFGKRNIITLGEPAGGEVEHIYALSKLESYLSEVAPILATDRIGVYAGEEVLEESEEYVKAVPIIFVDKDEVKVESRYVRDVPAGKYVCMAYGDGRLEKYHPSFEKVKAFLRENHMRITGPIFQIYKIDVTMTSDRGETLLEIQIPVEEQRRR